jgi:acid phosphatase (class A)
MFSPVTSRRFSRILSVFSLLALLLAPILTPIPAFSADSAHYLRAGRPDPIALLAPPPLPDSPEQAADLAEVQAVFHAATSNEVAAAFSERSFTVFNFTSVVGDFFQSPNLPATAAFFHRIQKDTEAVVDEGKTNWQRPRPFVVDPALARGELEKSFSYPSGHSTGTMVLALVLAEIFPDKTDALLSHARTMGWHRVQIARHFPTDVFAGRVLAQAIVQQLKRNPDFQRDLAKVKAEVAAARK